MVFLGPPGVGKTHLSVALAEAAIQAGFGAYFMTAHDLVTDLGRAYREGRLDRRMRVYLAPKVLIIDEMGYLPLDEWARHFFQLVSARYERGSIILTSNKSYGDWGSIFGDPIIATAILDRLLHHSTTINIRGESYRLKDRRKAGLFPRAEEDSGRAAPFLSPESLQNGPRRQGSAAPRKTSAPLTAPGRSTESTDMKERKPLNLASTCRAPPVGRPRTILGGGIFNRNMGKFQPELTLLSFCGPRQTIENGVNTACLFKSDA